MHLKAWKKILEKVEEISLTKVIQDEKSVLVCLDDEDLVELLSIEQDFGVSLNILKDGRY